jgi:hypothetical protein
VWNTTGAGPIGNAGSYHWLSDQEALNIRGVHTKATSGANSSVFMITSFGSPVAVLYDLKTGKETPLTALTRLFASTTDVDLYPSPDGKWALWPDKDGVAGATVDGKRQYRLREQSFQYGTALWLKDSRHWLHFLWNKDNTRIVQAHIHDIEAPDVVEKLPVTSPGPISESYPGITLAQDRLYVDRLHASNHPLNSPTELPIYECDLHAGAKPSHKYVVKMPPDTVIDDFVFSPRGDQIAWKLKLERVPPMARLLHRLYPRYSASPEHAVGLWVSDLDGRNLREIGHLDLHPAANSDTAEPEPEDVQWLPDGKRLSFLYKQALWIVPID